MWHLWNDIEHIAGDNETRTATVTNHATGVSVLRAFTAEENAAADAAVASAASLVDIEARLARIEAHLWPAPPDPTSTTGVPTMTTYGGV